MIYLMNKFNLSESDYNYLIKFVKTGKKTGKELERAYILLALHQNLKQREISQYYYVSRSTIWRIKHNYNVGGLDHALNDRDRPGAPIKYNEKVEAEIIALACSGCPKGRLRWTIELLTHHAKKIAGLENINRESVRLVLKKTSLSLG